MAPLGEVVPASLPTSPLSPLPPLLVVPLIRTGYGAHWKMKMLGTYSKVIKNLNMEQLNQGWSINPGVEPFGVRSLGLSALPLSTTVCPSF